MILEYTTVYSLTACTKFALANNYSVYVCQPGFEPRLADCETAIRTTTPTCNRQKRQCSLTANA